MIFRLNVSFHLFLFRLSGNAQKTSKDNELDSTLKRRGRRKGSKLESSNHSILGLKKRQINESEKVKRGQQRDLPLTELEKDLAHPDQHLAPTDKSPHDLVSFSSELVSELQNQVIENTSEEYVSIQDNCILSKIIDYHLSNKFLINF